jgi:hypothetical protein
MKTLAIEKQMRALAKNYFPFIPIQFWTFKLVKSGDNSYDAEYFHTISVPLKKGITRISFTYRSEKRHRKEGIRCSILNKVNEYLGYSSFYKENCKIDKVKL